MKKVILSVLLSLTLLIGSVAGVQSVTAEEDHLMVEEESQISSIDILDSGKDVLYYAFYTKDIDIEEGLKDIGLTNVEVQTLKEVALSQFENTNKTKALYKNKTSEMEVAEYNNLILLQAQQTKKEVKNVLKEKYEDTITYLTEFWNQTSRRESVSTIDWDASDDCDIEVYATQFDIDDYCVALPDKYLKFANLGWDYTYENPEYTVDVISYNRGTAVYNVPVNDVGPWNELDDYWHENRWEFNDLELSLPEAEAAFYDNYNDGCDEIGRVVSNPAGIDLSPSVASDLGFGYYESGWISIHLNF